MNNVAITAYIGRHILEIGGDKAVTPATVLASMKIGMPLALSKLPDAQGVNSFQQPVQLPTPSYPTTESILVVLKDLAKLDYLSTQGKRQGDDMAFMIGVRG